MRRLCSLCLLALLLSACSTPKDRFYVLGAPETTATASAPVKYTVAIGAVSIPELVNRSQLVVYQADSRVEIMEHERWAEPLTAAIPAVLARELRAQLPEARIAVYPQMAALDAACTINVDIQRFESRRGDSALLEGLWFVRCGKEKVRHGRSFIRESVKGDSYSALVAGYGNALAQMSKELAQAVRDSLGSKQ